MSEVTRLMYATLMADVKDDARGPCLLTLANESQTRLAANVRLADLSTVVMQATPGLPLVATSFWLATVGPAITNARPYAGLVVRPPLRWYEDIVSVTMYDSAASTALMEQAATRVDTLLHLGEAGVQPLLGASTSITVDACERWGVTTADWELATRAHRLGMRFRVRYGETG